VVVGIVVVGEVVVGADVLLLRELGGKLTHQNFPSSGPGVRGVVASADSVGAGVTIVRGNNMGCWIIVIPRLR